MIPKFRKKFISITASALFLMILLIISAINCVFIFRNCQILDSRLELVMSGHNPARQGADALRQKEDSPPQRGDRQDGNPHDSPDLFSGIFPKLEKHLRIQPDGCLVYLEPDGTLKEIQQDIPDNYSVEELSDIAAEIYQRGKEYGWCRYFKYRMEERTAPDGSAEIAVGLLNASQDLYSMFTMLLTSAGVGALSCLLLLLIVIFASGRAVKPLEEAYAKQKQFITDAGHELKTPLTVISADNELSRMIYGDSEWFDGIDSQVAKMNALVHSLITLARLDEEQKPALRSFNLSDAVHDTAKSFENRIHASGRAITLDIADCITYHGDEAKLRQVVSILMDNAAKYCDENGKIAVRLTADKKIRIQVINDFTSAADCDLSRVFERFYRADKARTADGSYGLGLSIAKSIVEQHKGEIRLNMPEQGRVMFEVVLGNSGFRHILS